LKRTFFKSISVFSEKNDKYKKIEEKIFMEEFRLWHYFLIFHAMIYPSFLYHFQIKVISKGSGINILFLFYYVYAGFQFVLLTFYLLEYLEWTFENFIDIL